jgi:hypothetical protein
VLVVTSMPAPELNEYPDRVKLLARNNPLDGEPPADAVEVIALSEEGLAYFEGES